MVTITSFTEGIPHLPYFVSELCFQLSYLNFRFSENFENEFSFLEIGILAVSSHETKI